MILAAFIYDLRLFRGIRGIESTVQLAYAYMALFGRRPNGFVPASVIASLAEYGKAVIAAKQSGTPVAESRFGWDFMSPVVLAMNGEHRDRVIQELYDASRTAADRPMATVGAYKLLCEWDGDLRDERFLALRDEYMNLLRDMKFPSGYLTGYESQRWIEIHGELRHSFDRITDVVVPSGDQVPPAKDLQPGQHRRVALMAPPPGGNEFHAERRADGTYGVFSIRAKSSDDPTRVRCEERLGPFGTMTDLLRALGADLGLRPYWADEDLDPYFPGRRN
jgi:hypothetical protein